MTGFSFSQLCGPVVGCLLLCGCYTTVILPKNPVNPTEVYLCDYGVHSSLLLPLSRRRYVEFFYGDWNWAALGHTGPIDAIEALFFSTQATLARRYVDQGLKDAMPRPIGGPITEAKLIVDGSGCRQVVGQLMQRWECHRITTMPIGSDLSYVKDDVPYSWTHDCNAQTADSLRAMGCRIDGFAIWSKFKIVAAK